ncbi:hypothetical protein OG897_10085 [Streptomyces sp. NBC_00237]|uniref:hypothetical protein n=1 Tax=Streptomyces sp. NBC_00237 TaxID=2975687 RepID=UPI0022541F27|nr:hypothetical protein [Streptomyces sp. NBC_00237]MCX5201800.1 hypothetical protein [Streptomyces sp. NBC_00237]
MGISRTPLRILRAALFTAVVVTLSVGSHVLLSGAPLPPLTVVAVGVAVFGLAYALAGRERGFGPIAALLVPLELAADTLFTTGQHVCYGPSGGPVAGALRAFGLDVLCGGTPVGTPFGAPFVHPGPAGRFTQLLASPDPALPWLLLGAHVAVGLLAALWLRRGEAALCGLLRTTACLAFRPLLLAVATAAGFFPVRNPGRPTPHRDAATLLRTRHLVHSVGRRGPPAAGFSLTA